MHELEIAGGRFTIDRATRQDVAAIACLLADDVLGAGRETAADSAYEAAFDEVDTDPNQYLAVIKAARGEIVGTFQLTLIPGLAHGGTKRLQIEAVRLASSTRDRGLGAAVLAWAHDYGRQHGCVLAQLTTDKRRTDAHRFYERLGYTATHEGYKQTL